MATLNLKTTHKPIREYYNELKSLGQLALHAEGQVSPAFASILRHCGKQFGWTLAEQYPLKRKGISLRLDGALIDQFTIVRGVWEAKDTDDDLDVEIKKKFERGYPKENIIFQAPNRAVIWQNGQLSFDEDISDPERLIQALETFFSFQPPEYEQWEKAVDEFKEKVPELGAALLKIIDKEAKENKKFATALEDFTDICRSALNTSLSQQAVVEMLIQHLLTERIFRKVFNNPDFAHRNIIAREIEKVIEALTSRAFSRHDFLKNLDRFYRAIEDTAATIADYSEKQAFLNTVYEKFFQGFSVKVADTHGIVYTPQPIVNFMVRSVEEILQKEFGRSLSDRDVHILDPFVGTGNFIINMMRQMKKTALPHKFAHELHCNEVMLLPYYIASMNIEHEYYELTGEYKPFDGICLVDTFELAETAQKSLAFMTAENTERVEQQKRTPIYVVIGNPPYNAGQVNENDNNKNRKYPVIDQRVRETYSRDSNASDKSDLNDVYVKAFRWASDRIRQNGEGVVAFVSNNSFIDSIAFDGMRRHLGQNFDCVYVIDLGGNVRKNPKLSGTTHNVFGIQVGVGISLLVKTKSKKRSSQIFYARVGEDWRMEHKYDFLDKKKDWSNIDWQKITPDAKYTWLTKGMHDEFGSFLPLGTQKAKAGKGDAIFRTFSLGANTNRDSWAYNFSKQAVLKNISNFIETYNSEVDRWHNKTNQSVLLDSFIINDEKCIKWSSRLKECLLRGQKAILSDKKIRKAQYRPFCFQYLYFDSILTHRRGRLPIFLPTEVINNENRIICLRTVGNPKPFHCIVTNMTPDLHLTGDTQCFPYYTYDEDGGNRRENITDWALKTFRNHYAAAVAQPCEGLKPSQGSKGAKEISKWDIFHYIYGLLHHPKYREKYAANLRRELPRIPFAPDFWAFAKTGKTLAELHVNYEEQPEYKLEFSENEGKKLNWRVEKMKLSKDKKAILYNDFLTLHGVPPEAFEYRLGNRSALDWIIDQYRIKTDKRSGIINDPNRADDPEYIVQLIGKIITVSVETVKLLRGLPKLYHNLAKV